MNTTQDTIEVRVARKRLEAEGICSFELEAVDGRPLPSFSAGAHVDVHLPGGQLRQYSLCNRPGETRHYELGILLDPASRGGSKALHEQVQEGERLAIGLPRNHFPLVDGARQSVLLAGGIGVTPILAMAEALAEQHADFAFHYCARSRRGAAFLERIASASWAARAQFHFDDEALGQRLDLAALLGDPAPDRHLYVCGPAGFIDAVIAAAATAGWPESTVHYERFANSLAPGESGAFEVVLAHSGRVVAVPAGQSVVEALAAVGVELPVSCEQGVCGTCVTRVLEGEPDHRDAYFTPAEQAKNDCFTPCCSRAKSSRLVLDL
jgi:vanillate O-demethylase ferredoxin subunit